MSGGHFDYKDRDFCFELFDWSAPSRRETYNVSHEHRKDGPFDKDYLLNELVWDVFCLFHDYDWYKSGDTGEDSWEESRKFFVKKWLDKGLTKEQIEKIIKEECTELQQNLLAAYGKDDNA